MSGRSVVPSYDPTVAFGRDSEHCLDGRRITSLGEFPVACGGHADVWKGRLENLVVAAKVIRPWSSVGKSIARAKLHKRLWREYLAWSCLSHPNVLELLGFSYNFPGSLMFPALISPWMSNGTVETYIETHEIADRLELLIGIAEGLSYLHTRQPPIVHGDLRAGNVLVSDSGVPCLSDFGLSRVLSETKQTPTSSEPAGSLRWMSPELLSDGGGVTVHSDVWAFGMTVLEVMTGNRPYFILKYDASVLGKITSGTLPPRPEDTAVRNLLNDELWAMCCQCWTFQSKERPTIQDAMSVLCGSSDPNDGQIPLSVSPTMQPVIGDSFAAKSPMNDVRAQSNPVKDKTAAQLVMQPQQNTVMLTLDPSQNSTTQNLEELAVFDGVPQLENVVRALRQCHTLLEDMRVLKDRCKEIHMRCVQQLLDFRHLVTTKYIQLAIEGVERNISKILNMVRMWSTWDVPETILHEYEIRYELEGITKAISRQAVYLGVLSLMAEENEISLPPVGGPANRHNLVPSFGYSLAKDITSNQFSDFVYQSAARFGVNIINDVRRVSEHPVSSDELRDVCPGQCPRNGKVSLKVFPGAKDIFFQDRFLEVFGKLQRLQHMNLESLYGVTIFDGTLHVVSSWSEYGDSLTYIKHEWRVDRLKLVAEVAAGLDFLHQNEIVHGDLRAAQILISGNGVAYISDFGMRELAEEFANVSPPPPPGSENVRWMAPELIDPKIRRFPIYRFKMSDVWSFGMVCLEIYTGEVPFSEQPRAATVQSDILNGIRPERPSTSRGFTGPRVPDALWELMYECWQQKWELRPSSAKVASTLETFMAERLENRRHYQAASIEPSPSTTRGSRHAFSLNIRDLGATPPESLGLSARSSNLFREDDEHCLDGSVTEPGGYQQGSHTDIWKGNFGIHKVAIKVIRPFMGSRTRHVKQRILERLWLQYTRSTSARHPNVLRYLGFSYDLSPVFPALISTWMSMGTLLSYLTKNPDADLYDLAVGVARGLSYLHAQEPPIVHGEVRTENILVSDSGVPCLSEVHITDILKLEGVHTSAHTVSSLRWMSPELLQNDTEPTLSSDVWAYGMTLLEMMTRSIPYQEEKSLAVVFDCIRRGIKPLRPESSVSEEIWAICLMCWNVDKRRRPHIHRVLDEFGG